MGWRPERGGPAVNLFHGKLVYEKMGCSSEAWRGWLLIRMSGAKGGEAGYQMSGVKYGEAGYQMSGAKDGEAGY